MKQQQLLLSAIEAQAELHHAYLLGLQLMVANATDETIMENWMFRLFRRQHLQKFLSSFEKLGLIGLPHAIACARYHVLSNTIGGVNVEYMAENERKAWVRFRYPRWLYDGPVICGIPIGVSRGFLRGWYAHNGVSLNNPRLGFVCVSEDMSGEFGLCGYFQEYDRELRDDERLRFNRDETPPPFDATQQPEPPAAQWSEERLLKARRNYALDYIRNGLPELAAVIGRQQTESLAGKAARLIGLQYFSSTAKRIHARDGDALDAAQYLVTMLSGLEDQAEIIQKADKHQATIRHNNLRILRNLNSDDASLVLSCWQQLWLGTMRSQRQIKNLRMQRSGNDVLIWQINTI